MLANLVRLKLCCKMNFDLKWNVVFIAIWFKFSLSTDNVLKVSLKIIGLFSVDTDANAAAFLVISRDYVPTGVKYTIEKYLTQTKYLARKM